LPGLTIAPTASPTSAFVPLAASDLKARLDFVLSTNVNAIDEARVSIGGQATTTVESHAAELMDIFDTGYYLLTGLTPQEEGWVPRILSGSDYIQLVDDEFGGNPELKGFAAFCCIPTPGGLEIIVNGGKPLPTVLASLAHEAGHARQHVANPDQSRFGRDTNMGAIKEAEAFAFQTALIRRLGEYAGVNATQVPLRSTADQFFDSWRIMWRDRFDDLTLEHQRGALLLWLAALHDPLLEQAKAELESQSILTIESLLALHDRFIDLTADEVDSYISELRSHFADDFNFIGGTLDRRKGSVPLEGFVRHVPVIFVIP